VLFEEALVELPDAAGWSLVDDIAQMLTDGATKDEILPGAWTARAYSLLGLERVERFEEAYGSMRGGPWFELAVWLAQRDEEKVAARMEAEKAANAAKKAKAKAKEATSGNRKGGKGKAQNADGGGNPRPAKRVPQDTRVQRPDALVDDIRQAQGSSEDERDGGAVVHGDAPRAPVVQSGQEQLGFLF
jgi:hypothetical protein